MGRQKSALRVSLFSIVGVFLYANAAISDAADGVYDEGVKYYENKDYIKASESFREVLRIRKSHRYYFNIAQCELGKERYDIAMEAFLAYLRGEGYEITKQRLDYSKDMVEKAVSLLGRLNVQGDVSAEIWVDNELRGRTPIDKLIYLLEGERRIVLKRGREIIYQKKFIIAPGDKIAVAIPNVQLTATESKPEQRVQSTTSVETRNSNIVTNINTSDIPPSTDSSTFPLKNVGIVVASIGGAAVVGSAITGAIVLAKKSKLKENCPEKEICASNNEDLKRSIGPLANATNVLLGIGGAAVITGSILTVIGHKRSKRTKEMSRLKIAPFINAGEAGVFIEGRF